MPAAYTRVEWSAPTATTTATTNTATPIPTPISTPTPIAAPSMHHDEQQLQQQHQKHQQQLDTSSIVEQLLNETLMLLDKSAPIDDINTTNFTFDQHNNNTNSNSNANSNSNNTLNALDDSNETLDTLAVLSIMLNYYYVPILVFAGSLGNILSVIVFSKTKLRKLSSSFYLAALAMSDTCFLLGLFIQWLNFVDIQIYNREFFCQFFTFFSNWACFCSAWFVVAFTVERFIAVAFPLKRQTMCTVRRAKFVIGALTAVGGLHCVPFYVSSAPIYSRKLDTVLCDVNTDLKNFMTYMNYFDTLVVFALPFVSIFILNTITSYRVWKFATVRRSLTMQRRKAHQLSRDSLTSSTYLTTSLKNQKHHTTQNIITDADLRVCRRRSEKRKVNSSSQLKVTKMLLIVSSVFVSLNLPSCVMRIETYLETQTSTNEKATVIWQYIFQLLFITNYGINFVLYCVSGQNFRKAVLSMFRSVSTTTTQREGNTQVTRVSEYCRNSRSGGGTSASQRRRAMSTKHWNEVHELRPLK